MLLGTTGQVRGWGEAARGREGGRRLLSPMRDAPGGIGHPHLEGTEVSPLPPFASLRLLNRSVLLE